MAIYNVNKTSSPTITQTATRSGGVMRVGGLNLSSLISALSGMSDNQKNRCDIIINDTYSLTQYDSTTYTNSSIQSNGSVISYILDTTTPEFKSRVGSTDTPINVTSWKIIYADDSISGGNSYPANRVSYDNAGTDLTSTTVQGAITEIINGGTENIFDGSIEDWNALSTAEKTAYDHAMINNDYSDNPVGNLNALTTTDKSSVVAAINELNSNYEGVDLTVKFANEISNYSDEWKWIQARLNAHNVRDLHVGDYIPIKVGAENHLAEIAGINTYRRTGDSGHEVGYHIDWITRDCYSQTVQFNTTNINNGTADKKNPFLASNLKSWLDSTLYPLLDAKLKNVIKAKRILAPSRYKSGATLTDDNSWAWQDFDKLWVPLETEIFDCLVWSTKGFGNGQAVQYPIFANSYEHRMKGVGPGGARARWWTASATSGNSATVVHVNGNGHSNHDGASGAFCVPVCFRTMEA